LGYTLSFSDELVSKFKGENIVTQISFLNANTQKVTSGGTVISGSWGAGEWINFDWPTADGQIPFFTKSAVFIGEGQNTKVTTRHIHSPLEVDHVFSNKYFKYCHYTYDCRTNHFLTEFYVQYGLVRKVHAYNHCNGRC